MVIGDANFWVVAPTPNSTFEITLAYVKQPVSITNTTQPTAAPAANKRKLMYQINIKIYFCMDVLVEAFGYLKGPADMFTILPASLSKSTSIVRDRTTRS